MGHVLANGVVVSRAVSQRNRCGLMVISSTDNIIQACLHPSVLNLFLRPPYYVFWPENTCKFTHSHTHTHTLHIQYIMKSFLPITRKHVLIMYSWNPDREANAASLSLDELLSYMLNITFMNDYKTSSSSFHQVSASPHKFFVQFKFLLFLQYMIIWCLFCDCQL